MWHTIDKSLNANNASRTVDKNAFVFSLKRNGNEWFRKYQTKDHTQSFVLHNEICFRLIHFGFVDEKGARYCDIDIRRKHMRRNVCAKRHHMIIMEKKIH